MKHFKKTLCLLLAIALCAGFLIPAEASDGFTSSDWVLDIIERYEGFIEYESGGYIGFGSSYSDCVAMFGSDCQPITRAQACQLTRSELASTESYLNSFLDRNGIAVNQNQFDALMDFSYNCGIGWMYSDCYFRQVILEGPDGWTEEEISSAFGAWVKAGGVVLPGLVNRRAEESEHFCSDMVYVPYVEYSTVFSDVALDAWYCDNVEYAYDLGFVSGMGDGTYGPEDTLTRAQAVQLLANFAGADLSGYAYSCYYDVPDDAWYAAAITWATACGYISGYGNGFFGPEDPVTREQLCTIISRYLYACGVGYGGISIWYADEDQIAGYAHDAVYYCSSLGLVSGMGDNCFCPGYYATRAQAATILIRLYPLMY